jgi:hypothetical protein
MSKKLHGYFCSGIDDKLAPQCLWVNFAGVSVDIKPPIPLLIDKMQSLRRGIVADWFAGSKEKICEQRQQNQRQQNKRGNTRWSNNTPEVRAVGALRLQSRHATLPRHGWATSTCRGKKQ